MSNRKPKPFDEHAAAQENPLGVITEALFGGGVDAVVDRQQQHGNESTQNTDTLPTKGLFGPDGFGEVVTRNGGSIGESADNLFTYATLPPGWTKKSDGGYWTTIFDTNGRQRALFFYKAAFYDRDAHIQTTRRYHVDSSHVYDNPGELLTKVLDRQTGEIVFQTDKLTFNPDDRESRWPLETQHENEVRAWLEENFPEHSCALAYWDDLKPKDESADSTETA